MSNSREWSQYGLLDSLRDRRSRRMASAGRMPGGPFKYESREPARPLTRGEEAALAFAACGITGCALGDLDYSEHGGGNIMAGFVGRTVASGDGIQSVAVAVTNDLGTWLLKRPRDFEPGEIRELIRMARAGEFEALYERSRVRILDHRARPPVEPIFNILCNRWSVHTPGSTVFVPINDLTLLYINGLLEIFNEGTGVFIVDERANFQPAGLTRFGRSRGGHLYDDVREGRVATIHQVELMVAEFASVEQGMVAQNLGLMAQALGLGGFPSFANHDFGWFEALGFRMDRKPASRYLAAGRLAALGLKLLGRDIEVPEAVGLEAGGQPVLKAFRPPWHATMREAVMAVVDLKFGAHGIYRDAGQPSAWREASKVRASIPPLSEKAIEATVAYCEYVWGRYGRFPAWMPPFRTVIVHQAHHLDGEFYRQFEDPGRVV